MLLKAETLKRIAKGEVDLAFRRWRRASVRSGGRVRTAAGELGIGSVEVVDEGRLSGSEAKRAGFADLSALRASLAKGEGDVYRIEIVGLRPDGREALREDTDLSEEARAALLRQLERWNTARRPGYGQALLARIDAREGAPAGEIADALAVEKATLKRDVRALKEMGLTESLVVGYRLAPRGRAALVALGGQ